MAGLLKNLNLEQKKAVKHQEGPLLIIAGAGTGKTKVITTRIAYLIEKELAKPNEILALTFTDKAAREMEERVDLILPMGIINTYISTFHSFGDRILREHAVIFGISPDYRLLKKSEQVLFLTDNLFRLKLHYLRPPTNPTKFVEMLLRIISRAKDENVSAQEYLDFALSLIKKSKNEADKRSASVQVEIARAYLKYQKLLRQNNYLDFGDQMFLLYRGLLNHPELLKILRDKFKFIMVDEYQDTNYIQNELIKLLASPKNNIAVVGDDDQSIYKFRGAAISNIIKFVKDFPRSKQVILTKNYRSTQKILDAAYNLIKNNNPDRLEVTNKINKKLLAVNKRKGKLEFLHFDTDGSEADRVAEIMIRLHDKGVPYKEMAILLRANSQAQPFIRSLNLKGIPNQFSGDTNLYHREEIQLMMSFLRSLVSNRDSLSLYSLAQSEVYNIDMNDLIEMVDLSRRRNENLFTIMRKIDELSWLPISNQTKEKVTTLVGDIKKYRELSRKKSPGVILYQYLDEKKILKELAQLEGTPENEIKVKNISFFFYQLKQFEEIIKRPTLIHLLEYLDSLLESGIAPEERDFDPDIEAVNILTVHAAKGLEFEAVFLSSLIDGRFPSFDRGESIDLPNKFIKEVLPVGDWHIEEERRLFYVAMTRAKNILYLTSATNYGGERARRPSSFIGEALGKETIAAISRDGLATIEQIALFREGQELGLKRRFPRSLRLSFRQVDDYLTCPLKYKYSSVLRLPVLQHFAVAFGNAIHQTISDYYRAIQAGGKLNYNDLVKKFQIHWQNEGFLSQEHQKESLKDGKEMIKQFYKNEEKRPCPKEIEKSFSFNIDSDTITGRIDAIFEEEGKVRIIDFKSSSVDSKDKAYSTATGSLQLGIYALAYQELKGKLPDSVGLYFLGSGITGESKPTERRIETVKKKIHEAREGIAEQIYDPKPSKFNCTYCAYSKICPYSLA